jgi:hypothetical protein
MNENERPTPTHEALTRQISQIMDQAESELINVVDAVPAATDVHPPRPGLDSEMAEIKNSVLRMGSLVEDAIRAAIVALV